jgi:hypothetical protein
MRLGLASGSAQERRKRLRPSGTASTEPNCMNAAFMLFQRHGWDIHVVCMGG